MPIIQCSSAELRSRGKQIQELLQPLTGRPIGPAWDYKKSRFRWIIAMHDGAPSTTSHQDWRFATSVSNLRANYFEVWRAADGDYWHLYQAYLNIFQRIREQTTYAERKFLSLHCDPNEPDEADHAEYKREPHLHIQAADEPFPHAHIVLTGGHSDLVLISIDSLSEAMEWAVLMLRDEVLNALSS